MSIKVSTGLRNYLLDTGSLDAALAAGFIKIYAGTVPDTADTSIGSATLLCTISDDATGTGINFEAAAASGVLEKDAQTWRGVNAATGTATFYRHVTASDTGASSTTERRIQGTIGTAGADMNLSDTSLTSSASQSIDFYAVALPTF